MKVKRRDKVPRPDEGDIRAVLNDWPPEAAYLAVNKRWLVSRDGRIWEYHARGSEHIPGDPSSGVWCENCVVAWTGRYRELPNGERRKCTIAVAIGQGADPGKLLESKGLYRVEPKDSGDGKVVISPEFDPSLIERRRQAGFSELAEQGVQAAQAMSIRGRIADAFAEEPHHENAWIGGGI